MLKRVAAVMLLAPLLHLNVVRADIACSDHEPAATQSASDAHHEHGEHTPAAPEPEDACDTPAQAECCQALASCGTALGVADAAVDPNDDWRTAVSGLARVDMPASAIPAPEPPPPRV